MRAKLLAASESSYDHVSEDISNDLFGRAVVTGRGRLALCEGVYDFHEDFDISTASRASPPLFPSDFTEQMLCRRSRPPSRLLFPTFSPIWNTLNRDRRFLLGGNRKGVSKR